MPRSSNVTPLKPASKPVAVELFPMARADLPPMITTEHIAAARRVGRGRPDVGLNLEAHYRIPVPPPGVLPPDDTPDGKARLAQDQAVLPALGWGGANSGWSAFAEGTEFLGYSYLALLSQRAEFRVVSEIIAYEMTREWVEFKSVSEDDAQEKRIKELVDAIDGHKLQTTVRTAIEGDGFFGRGHVFVSACDPDDRDELAKSIGSGRDTTSRGKVEKGKPLSFKSVEAMWCYPTDYNSNDPLQPDWYKPKQWFVMGKAVHHTRFLTLVGRPMPDILKPVYLFGGLSMSQMIKPYVENWLDIRQAVAQIVQAYSVWVLHTNMSSRLQRGGDQLAARIEMFTQLLKNGSVAAVDKDTEDLTNISAPLGTLDMILSKAQEQMASVCRIPLVKLLGIQPAGLNASSEGEIRAFYDWIKAFQEALLRGPLTTMFDLIQLSIWGEVDDDITFEFKDLWQLDEAGDAAIRQTEANTDDTYVAMGAVDSQEVREKLAKDPNSPYAGLNLDKHPAPTQEPEGGYEPSPEEQSEVGGLLNCPGGTQTPQESAGSDPKVKGAGRLAATVTNRAANFGGAASGGFKAQDVRLALDHVADALGLISGAMDPGLVETIERWRAAGSPGLGDRPRPRFVRTTPVPTPV